jgi:hypothetical protein
VLYLSWFHADRCGADPLVRAGPPGPALRSDESASCDPRKADRGIGRGPAGPPHSLMPKPDCAQSQRRWSGDLPHRRKRPAGGPNLFERSLGILCL